MSYRGGRENHAPACIFVGNLPEDITVREIENIFGKFGEIRDIDIKKGKTTNYTAYAFIEFYHLRDAEDAVEARDGYNFDKYRLRVEFSGKKRSERSNTHGDKARRYNDYGNTRTEYRLVISNISSSCRWQDVKDHMRRAGPVGHVCIKDGRGYVEYINKSDMKYALDKYDGSELQSAGRTYKIKVRMDDRRSHSHSNERSRRSPSPKKDVMRSRSRSRSPAFDRYHEHKDGEDISEDRPPSSNEA